MTADPIRLLAIVEARTITGPAKNLLEFCRLARAREGRRVETTIVTWRRPDQRGRDDFLQSAAAAASEVEVVEENAALDRRALSALRRIVDRRDPHILQTHAVKSHFLLRASGLARRKPWVAFHHGYTFQDAKMRAYNLLDRWSLRAPKRIVTMSGVFADQLVKRGVPRERITVLHNAIDPDWLAQTGVSRAQARRDLGIAGAQPLVIAVGRLSREKAFHHLLEAFATLRRDKPEFHPILRLLGDGPERSHLENRIAALGLTGCAKITGHLQEVRPFYAAADVLAISSLTEGSPNALLEAMVAGVPVVATRVGGIPEIVSHEESALLVPPGDPPVLAAALARTLTAPVEAQSRAARAHQLIQAKHSPEARVTALIDLYVEVLKP